MHTDICAASGSPGAAHQFSGPPHAGKRSFMSDIPEPDRVDQRAELLPEERAAGSADPEAQAEAILEESDEREADPSSAPDSFLERRTSDQTVTTTDEAARPAEPPD
jgi:hypothetical protein